ncbi:Proteasome activator complex subunit 3 [Paramuricea clavata]|uniref:Proteasome activator complex subunit 3 n=1 Tax=Paramuricea clavata TaxID=317549 RepID=A0A6S7LPL8_PARCT|nr:Proteasome activator complex subunit 3 [Paramuricea clavata]
MYVLVGPLKAIPLNEPLVDLIESLKPEIQDLMENCNSVKTWIQLLIPRIEDGNNFGVSIQEDILGEVTRIEAEAASFLDQISRYFITRGKVVSKVVKYPHIMDYRRTVVELDEKEYISLKLCCCELKNHYLCLHDAISKNLDKIKKPRSSNTDSLY